MFWICKQRHWALATVDIGAIQMHHIIIIIIILLLIFYLLLLSEQKTCPIYLSP